MNQRFLVLDTGNNPVEKEVYQRAMVKYYRETVTVCPIPDDSNYFDFPHEGTLTIGPIQERLTVNLESEDKIGLRFLKESASLDGRFKLESIK